MFDHGLFIFHQKSNVDFRGQLLFIDKSEFDNFGLVEFTLVLSFLFTYKFQDLDFFWALNLKISYEVFILGIF